VRGPPRRVEPGDREPGGPGQHEGERQPEHDPLEEADLLAASALGQDSHGDRVGRRADETPHPPQIRRDGDAQDQARGVGIIRIQRGEQRHENRQHHGGRGGVGDEHRQHEGDRHDAQEHHGRPVAEASEDARRQAAVEARVGHPGRENEAPEEEPDEGVANDGHEVLPVLGRFCKDASGISEQPDLEGDHEDAHREAGDRFRDPQRRREEQDEERPRGGGLDVRAGRGEPREPEGESGAAEEDQDALGLADLERSEEPFGCPGLSGRLPLRQNLRRLPGFGTAQDASPAAASLAPRPSRLHDAPDRSRRQSSTEAWLRG
jgi:hypothetical protein